MNGIDSNISKIGDSKGKKIDRKALFPRLFNRILVNIIFFIGNQERKIDVFINYILG
jgi:hypothetical protein